MKVTNKTSKVIGIGGAACLPGTETEVKDAYAVNPIVKYYEDRGYISLAVEVKETPAEPVPAKGKKEPKHPHKAEPLPLEKAEIEFDAAQSAETHETENPDASTDEA